MTFSEFVKLYWNKVRRSGSPWTPAAISDDSGLSLDIVNMYLNWCQAQSGLADDALISRFDDTMTVIVTPFGSYLGSKGAVTQGTSTIGAMPVDAFWAQLRKILGK